MTWIRQKDRVLIIGWFPGGRCLATKQEKLSARPTFRWVLYRCPWLRSQRLGHLDQGLFWILATAAVMKKFRSTFY
jgi:hypothetical protein